MIGTSLWGVDLVRNTVCADYHTTDSGSVRAAEFRIIRQKYLGFLESSEDFEANRSFGGNCLLKEAPAQEAKSQAHQIPTRVRTKNVVVSRHFKSPAYSNLVSDSGIVVLIAQAKSGLPEL